MKTLGQAKKAVRDAGEPILWPFEGLRKYEAIPRRGELTMIIGGPAAGKSFVTQYALMEGDGNGNKDRVLYYCSDTSAATIYTRAAAMSTNYTQADVKRLMDQGATEALEKAVAENGRHIFWQFGTHASPELLEEDLNAYVEVWDRLPDVLVIDILADIMDNSDADEFRALSEATIYLRDIAVETGMAVIALHHVNSAFEDSAMPVPLSGVRGRVSKVAGLILTIYRPEDGELRISPVKNRQGMADPTGRLFARIRADFDRAVFGKRVGA